MVRSVRGFDALCVDQENAEESDNQETGLCVAALWCGSKWVPTTIHNAAPAATVDGKE